MSETELPPTYDPKITDGIWYSFWQEGDFFKADPNSSRPPFTLVMHPPNVTGMLHMGHALVTTLQDILARYKRMKGFETLWIPGTDHAGIATQMVVERFLLQTEGKKRSDYSRDAFIEIVWQWKERYESRILDQLKRLGGSCDWSRLRFTMDEECSRAVRSCFKKLFDEGLIYRGDYLVNWDPITLTALADDEVEYEERAGWLWFFKFPLQDKSGHILIATTRPETMLGDVAVAVNPKDLRYTSVVGKSILHPLTQQIIPLIADTMVDPDFGTGAVKITPAHDHDDYRMAARHNLPLINIFTKNGHINEKGGAFAGLSRERAREQIVAQMQKLNLVEKILPHTHRVGLSYRSKALIEPFLSKQWFVKAKPFIEPLQKAVQEGKVKILPNTWEATYFHWIDNLRDWCISRQLWWGHRIPVWHNLSNGRMICHDGDDLPQEVAKNPSEWVQDNDVLDTWFSSALWPISTLGWPEKTPDLKKFYPISVLVTGHDILFFWVARMILMCEYLTGEPPFKETFLHGLIFGKSYFQKNPDGTITYIMGQEKENYDKGHTLPSDVYSKWEKLSKTKGNVIDPRDMIDKYGTDAVRMTLASCANRSPQIDLDQRLFEEFKHFANKIWNGTRFVFMNIETLADKELESGVDESLLELEDRWIFSRMGRTIEQVTQALDSYNFDRAADLAYNFFWKDFCAYYLEISKPYLTGKREKGYRKNKQIILVDILTASLRLLHPFAPFITEELFQRLQKRFKTLAPSTPSDPYTHQTIEALKQPACIIAPYPVVVRKEDICNDIEAKFDLFEKLVHAIRTIRAEMKIPPQVATDIYLIGEEPTLRCGAHIITALVRTHQLHIMETPPPIEGLAAQGIVENVNFFIPLPKELAQKERNRQEKEREKLQLRLHNLKIAVENPDFLAKASRDVIEKQQAAIRQLEASLELLEEKLK